MYGGVVGGVGVGGGGGGIQPRQIFDGRNKIHDCYFAHLMQRWLYQKSLNYVTCGDFKVVLLRPWTHVIYTYIHMPYIPET